ncbi:hypothetical protein JYU34_010036 [Plutella xylostella]|uniref:Uncharacterized protein n=1 Tax=Plutella xylostella TaxID=51655 RepID=A0ABQ7QHI7_PLUXY|nr:hypothetical protein JYU34_010036 [Plutella xylostella]
MELQDHIIELADNESEGVTYEDRIQNQSEIQQEETELLVEAQVHNYMELPDDRVA